VPVVSRPLEEISLLELLVHHYSETQPLVHEYLRPEHISDPVCRELVELLMVDLPEALTEGFQDFDEATQRVISRVQVEESRAIDNETSPVELAQRYIILFWKHKLEQELEALRQRSDLSNEERFKENTRTRHNLHALSSGWDEALPMIEAHLHTDTDDME